MVINRTIWECYKIHTEYSIENRQVVFSLQLFKQAQITFRLNETLYFNPVLSILTLAYEEIEIPLLFLKFCIIY